MVDDSDYYFYSNSTLYTPAPDVDDSDDPEYLADKLEEWFDKISSDLDSDTYNDGKDIIDSVIEYLRENS